YRLEGVLPSPIKDIFHLTAVNPTGRHCLISANVGRRVRISRDQRETWARVTRHLAAGYRLRRTLAEGQRAPEAIWTSTGEACHAEADALGARADLQRAVLKFEEARGRLRSTPDEALHLWRPLVSARWSLLEEFERDGKRFIVARRNEAASGREALTSREQ